MSVQKIETAEAFDTLLSSNIYTIIDFTASWCGPCKAIAPQLDKLASKHSVESYLAFAKVDVDDVQEVAQKYGISAMPTFMFFKEGNQVAVNGDALIRGADVRKLTAAAEKLSGLAVQKKEKANAASSTTTAEQAKSAI